MKKIYIFGVGRGKEIVRENLLDDKVELLGYIDNAANNFPNGVDGKTVQLLTDIEDDFDYIIVSVMRYKHIDEQLYSSGIRKAQIINFFSFEDSLVEDYWSVLNKNGWRMEAISFEFQKKVRPYCYNLIYEMNDFRNNTIVPMPKILPAEEALKQIKEKHKSIARFGDGEFELILKRGISFQVIDEVLALRLNEIVKSYNNNIIIAIADNYGSLEKYTEEAAEEIRAYLTPQVRQEHMAVLDLDKVYYDAYISRPYIIYKDKKASKKRFEEIKDIWKNRDILIVEGNQTRMGVGNDLFDEASSVRRILAPSVNAFSRYQEILDSVKKTAKDKLVLIALGATATVLAYDLAVSGFWALDIGHLDLEYEWYLSGVQERYRISYKYVNEINGIMGL